jgi:hypothetical protein
MLGIQGREMVVPAVAKLGLTETRVREADNHAGQGSRYWETYEEL